MAHKRVVAKKANVKGGKNDTSLKTNYGKAQSKTSADRGANTAGRGETGRGLRAGPNRMKSKKVSDIVDSRAEERVWGRVNRPQTSGRVKQGRGSRRKQSKRNQTE